MFNWMPQKVKRILRITAGFALLILGVICGPIPIVQGWPFVLAGLAILAVDYVWAHRWMTRIKSGAAKVADKVRGKKTD
jgi:hypothetical protein